MNFPAPQGSGFYKNDDARENIFIYFERIFDGAETYNVS